jgi:hypothetical protein
VGIASAQFHASNLRIAPKFKNNEAAKCGGPDTIRRRSYQLLP